MNINKFKQYINKNSKLIFKILVILGIIIVSAVVNFRQNHSDEIDLNKVDSGSETTAQQTANSEKYYVDISGEVKNPGVYQVKKGTRLVDLIEKAGGLTQKANLDAINQASFVEDGSKIIIPSKDGSSESSGETGETSSGITATGKVNINQASQDELMTLPGVGAVIAQRIIEYRSANRFESIEDIKNVKGIGDATYEKLKDLIAV